MNDFKSNEVDTYIENAKPESHRNLNELRNLIKVTIPSAEEGISYGVPFYKYYGNFVGFAVYEKHVSFGFGANILNDEESEKIKKMGYKLGKGTMQIKFEQEIPINEIRNILVEKAKMNETDSNYKSSINK